ncbi:unnamed protein product [Adineta steineri]|uniref:UBC core domain-containing protein n=1 Tax=Adineta steineri TaxID=433720 RepID=A0A814AH96_9BILA|nr:unnamed protein product [Adineta steineri]CAF3906516.1 unnamed protein product [Adineta steineri]
MSDRERLKALNTVRNIFANWESQADARVKFVIVNSPLRALEGNDTRSLAGEIIIDGRLLPNSELFKNHSLPVQIILDTTYPSGPPKVKFSTKLFHPNIDKKGYICTDLLTRDRRWTPVISIREIIEEVTDIIDNPNLNDCIFDEAAKLLDSDKAAYERKALEAYKKIWLPR